MSDLHTVFELAKALRIARLMKEAMELLAAAGHLKREALPKAYAEIDALCVRINRDTRHSAAELREIQSSTHLFLDVLQDNWRRLPEGFRKRAHEQLSAFAQPLMEPA